MSLFGGLHIDPEAEVKAVKLLLLFYNCCQLFTQNLRLLSQGGDLRGVVISLHLIGLVI